MNEDKYRLAKVILGIILLVILYLFALNGRYTVNRDGETVVDRWKLEYVDEKISVPK